MSELFIFDNNDTLLEVLDNSKENRPFFNVKHFEVLNRENTLEFEAPADTTASENIIEGNLAGFIDLDGDFQLFEMTRIDERHGATTRKIIFGEHNAYELDQSQIIFLRLKDKTAQQMLTEILTVADPETGETTRWTVGTVDTTTARTLDFRLISRWGAIKLIASEFGLELKFNIALDANGKIGTRSIDLTTRGTDIGKRFVFGKDTQRIRRELDLTETKTAMFGFGKAIETPKDGKALLRFDDIVWTVAGGDDADKPLGESFVEDPTAKTNFGLQGGTVNRYGIVFFDEEVSQEDLLQKTWDFLQTVNGPKVSFEVTGFDLERVLGLSSEKIRIGDTVKAIDTTFKPELRLSTRIGGIRRDIDEPEKDVFIISNFDDEVVETETDVRQQGKVLNRNRGVWEENSFTGNLLRDGSFENIPRTGNVDANQSFSVDTAHPNLANVFNWTFNGSDPRIVSTVNTSLRPESLFDLQGAFISQNSEIQNFHPIHSAVALDGPYTASIYVAANFGTSVDGTAKLRYGAVDFIEESIGTGDGSTVAFSTSTSPIARFTEVIFLDAVSQTRDTDYTIDYETGIVTFTTAPGTGVDVSAEYEGILKRVDVLQKIRTGVDQRFIWKRMQGTIEDLPAATEKFVFELTIDTDDNVNVVFTADGAQAVPLENPTSFQPESTFWQFMQNQFDAVNPIRLSGGSGSRGNATFTVEADTDDTDANANPIIELIKDNSTEIVQILLNSSDNLLFDVSGISGEPTITTSTETGKIHFDGNIPTARATKTNNQTISNLITTAIQFNTENWDRGDFIDIALDNESFVINEAGIYMIVAMATFDSNSTGFRRIGIQRSVPSTSELALSTQNATNGDATRIQVSAIVSFNANDEFKVIVLQNSGANRTLVGSASTIWCSIYKISNTP